MGVSKNILVILCYLFVYRCAALNNYDLDMEKLEVLYLDPTYGTINGNVSSYNATTKVFNANGSLFQKISSEDDIRIIARGYVYAGGDYRPVPYRVNFTICQAYKHIYNMLLQQFRQQTNIPSNCPIEPGYYYIVDFVPNVYMLPTAIPPAWEKMMLYVNGTNDSGDLIGSMKAYGRVIHNKKPIGQPKRKLSREQMIQLISLLKSL